MKNVLFLQSWYSQVTDNWYPWLKEELEKRGFATAFPDIAEFRSDKPDLKVILGAIKSLDLIDAETIIVGHSLGSLVALRLAEQLTFDQMILVSGWDFDDLTAEHALFWENKIDHELIKKHVKNIVVIHSDNDPYTTAFSAEGMAKRLEAKFVLIPGGGHLTSKDGINQMPEILDNIK